MGTKMRTETGRGTGKLDGTELSRQRRQRDQSDSSVLLSSHSSMCNQRRRRESTRAGAMEEGDRGS